MSRTPLLDSQDKKDDYSSMPKSSSKLEDLKLTELDPSRTSHEEKSSEDSDAFLEELKISVESEYQNLFREMHQQSFKKRQLFGRVIGDAWPILGWCNIDHLAEKILQWVISLPLSKGIKEPGIQFLEKKPDGFHEYQNSYLLLRNPPSLLYVPMGQDKPESIDIQEDKELIKLLSTGQSSGDQKHDTHLNSDPSSTNSSRSSSSSASTSSSAKASEEEKRVHESSATIHPSALEEMKQNKSTGFVQEQIWREREARRLIQPYLSGFLHRIRQESYRLWPKERCILIETASGLKTVYFARGFVSGLEQTLFDSIHYFVYAMLAYRFLSRLGLVDAGGFISVQDIFQSSSQKGIDSLVHTLAKAPAWILKLILSMPAIVALLKGFWSTRETEGLISKTAIKHVLAKSVEEDIKIYNLSAQSVKIKEMTGNQIGNHIKLNKWVAVSKKIKREIASDGKNNLSNQKEAFIDQFHAMEFSVSRQQLKAATMEIDEFKDGNNKGSKKDSESQGVHFEKFVGQNFLLKSVTIADGDFIAENLEGTLIEADHLSGEFDIKRTKLEVIEAEVKDRVAPVHGIGYSLWWDMVIESLPVVSNLVGVSNKIQQLERAIRWDGRLPLKARQRVFEIIEQAATEGGKITQFRAMESLAKIAHGIGLQDLKKLKNAGYKPDIISDVLRTKLRSKKLLVGLSEEKKEEKGNRREQFASIMRKIYACYLLWWLGDYDWKKKWKRNGFFLLKLSELGFELFFISVIVKAIIAAINCPDKPGFQFAEGYADWASDYTAECFSTRLSLFRTLDPHESVNGLIAEIADYHLTDLMEVNLILKNLTSEELYQLMRAIVQKAPRIEALTLWGNPLWLNVTPALFNGLSHLRYLILQENGFTTLPSNAFANLIQLEWLYITGSKLTTLPPTLFYGLTQLSHLIFDDNPFLELPAGIFNGLSQLQELWLMSMFSPTLPLPTSIFEGLNQLTMLYLISNEIDTLPTGIFDNLSELRLLDLENNSLKTLNSDVFSRLTQLRQLRLNSNQLVMLPNGTFDGLNKLWGLFIQDNQFITLPDCVSEILPQLIGFGFSGPTITTEITAIFSQLVWLELSGFTTLSSDQLKNLSQLQQLMLVNNQFTVLPSDLFKNLNNLRYLWLHSNTQLTMLPSSLFEGLDRLEWLYLTHNYQLTDLSTGIFDGLNGLKVLGIFDNIMLTGVPMNIFDALSQLETLGLSFNKLNTLPMGIFDKMNRLTDLDLSYNQLNDLAILNLTQGRIPYQLETLYINNNPITEQGIEALLKVLPCSNLKSFAFDSSLDINDTDLQLQEQMALLEKVCADRLCHANLPPTDSCPTSSSLESQMTYSFASSENKRKTPHLFYNPHRLPWKPPFLKNSGRLMLSDFKYEQQQSAEISTTANISAIIIASVGVGILLYKNTLLQSVINKGWRLVQRCLKSKPSSGTPETSTQPDIHQSSRQVSIQIKPGVINHYSLLASGQPEEKTTHRPESNASRFNLRGS